MGTDGKELKAFLEKLNEDPKTLGLWLKYPKDAIKGLDLSEEEAAALVDAATLSHELVGKTVIHYVQELLKTDEKGLIDINFSCSNIVC